MPSLKSIRKRIVSVKNTQKITKAMKMVAAAKLRRAQENVQAIRPYAQRLGHIASDLAEQLAAEPFDEAPAFDPVELQAQDAPHRPDTAQTQGKPPSKQQLQRILLGKTEQRIRVVAITSDRGLVGAFNSNVIRRTERFATEKLGHEHKVDLVVLGKKGQAYFKRRNLKVVRELGGAEPKTVAARARELGRILSESLLRDEADAIYVIYNEFKNAATQTVQVERLMPLRLSAPVGVAPESKGTPESEPRTLVDFLYEPDRDAVLAHLLPLYLETELHRILLEAIAGEFGAQMSAMDNASRNAKEMISRLTLQYNRARQATITKELMEIVGGAEALKG